jgi:ankyrin repeat protein
MTPFRSVVLRVCLAAMGAAALMAAPGCSARPVAGGPQELALAQAAAAHDVAAVQRLLDAGADPNRVVQIDGGSRAPWAIALREVRPHQPDRVAIVKAMLKAHASTSTTWDEGRRTYQREPIAMAMLYPDAEVIRALIDAGFDLRQGQGALVSAIESGDMDVARVLVDAGVNPNCRPGALTPLVAAIEARDLAMVTYLEAHGAREKP